MASSSSNPPPPAETESQMAVDSTPQPCSVPMVPFKLSAATRELVSKLATSVKADQDVSGQMLLLEAKSMVESKNWSKVFISQESWNFVTAVRESITSADVDELISAVSKADPAALYLSQSATVIQFCKGISPIQSFVTMAEDCALMIPLHVPEQIEASIRESTGSGRGTVLSLPLEQDSETTHARGMVIKGNCTLTMALPNPMVCVVFCLAKAHA